MKTDTLDPMNGHTDVEGFGICQDCEALAHVWHLTACPGRPPRDIDALVWTVLSGALVALLALVLIVQIVHLAGWL